MTNIERISQMDFDKQKKYIKLHYSFFPNQNNFCTCRYSIYKHAGSKQVWRVH